MDETIKYLRNLISGKSTDPEVLSPQVLKKVNHEKVFPLLKLFSESLPEGKVQEGWKLANVSPIPKKGDKKCALINCPISLTTVIRKIMNTSR